jgi:hypothetical protein
MVRLAWLIQRILRGIRARNKSLAASLSATMLSSTRKTNFLPRPSISATTSAGGRWRKLRPKKVVTEQKLHEKGQPRVVSTMPTGR